MTDFAPPPVEPRPAGGGSDRSTRVPPQNLEAERSLLGAMLLTRDAVSDAVDVVIAEHFYRPSHGHVFEAIVSLYGAGEPADTVTVADELGRAGLLESIGGAGALVDLQMSTPAATNAKKYAEIVYDHAVLRRLIGVAGEIAELGFSTPDDVTKAVDSAEAMMYDVAQGRVVDSMSGIHDLLKGNLDRLEELYEQGETHHRHAHRLSRSRRTALGAPAQQPDRGRRPSGHGQDELSPSAWRPTRRCAAAGRCCSSPSR